MAGFKAHITVGSFTGIGVMAASYALNLATNFYISIGIMVAAFIGSFLPDLDSDTGLPFKIIFTSFAVILSLLGFYITYNQSANIYIALVSLFFIFVSFRYGVGYLFKKFSDHRGIFHSIPMAIIFMLITLLIAFYLNIPYTHKFLISIAVGIGFISHLVLDEIFSTNILSGKIWKPKKSLGTALKLYSKNKKISISVYIIIAILLSITYPLMYAFISLFKK